MAEKIKMSLSDDTTLFYPRGEMTVGSIKSNHPSPDSFSRDESPNHLDNIIS